MDLSRDQKYEPPLLLLAIIKIIEKDYTELENTVNGATVSRDQKYGPPLLLLALKK
jgi:hypothetical protein